MLLLLDGAELLLLLLPWASVDAETATDWLDDEDVSLAPLDDDMVVDETALTGGLTAENCRST